MLVIGEVCETSNDKLRHHGIEISVFSLETCLFSIVLSTAPTCDFVIIYTNGYTVNKNIQIK